MEEFYHGLIKKYIILFGSLFNDVQISRQSSANTTDHSFKIPISYGPKEKFLARAVQDAKAERKDAMKLPRMSFELVDFQYNGQRALNRRNLVITDKDARGNNNYRKMGQPVPYDIIFELNIISKNIEDAAKITEQIVPNFQPEWSVSAFLIDELPEYTLDIPIELISVTPSDNYDSNFEERRAVSWNLTFNMKAWLFPPVKQQKVIKVAKVNIYTDLTANSEYEQITTFPGLDANGVGTTLAANSIPWSEIDEDDNWDYVVTIQSFEATG